MPTRPRTGRRAGCRRRTGTAPCPRRRRRGRGTPSAGACRCSRGASAATRCARPPRAAAPSTRCRRTRASTTSRGTRSRCPAGGATRRRRTRGRRVRARRHSSGAARRTPCPVAPARARRRRRGRSPSRRRRRSRCSSSARQRSPSGNRSWKGRTARAMLADVGQDALLELVELRRCLVEAVPTGAVREEAVVQLVRRPDALALDRLRHPVCAVREHAIHAFESLFAVGAWSSRSAARESPTLPAEPVTSLYYLFRDAPAAARGARARAGLGGTLRAPRVGSARRGRIRRPPQPRASRSRRHGQGRRVRP